ncbi:nucleotide sugar dehydrogenase [Psychroflexus sediminis]|uniref:UDP-glucose 6-dehydrogenase n=1 Tax=Psychroflexus sediminis TaxID=470826 RepID=A0A1G7Z2E2_9FLAO|nr:nucleotide sugar dehydrogenase [Psychroflexus sediminis]
MEAYTGADVSEVSRSIGMDSRIGSKFLKASVGFGGSCFQKDILNLVYIASSLGLQEVADYWEQVILMNDYQKHRFARKIVKTLYNTVADKKIAFLGWAFKKDTNDTRESAAIYVAEKLLQEQANISIYDPKVKKEQIITDLENLGTLDPEAIHKRITVVSNPYEAMKEVHAVAILTEWDGFADYDWQKVYENMMKPAFVFDGRGILDLKNLTKIGFQLFSLGKSNTAVK